MFTLHSPVFAMVRLSLFSQLISCHSLETPPSLMCSWHSPVFAKERYSLFSQLISFKSLLLYLETQPFTGPDLVSVSKLCYSYHKKGAFDWMTNGFYPWGGVFSPGDNGTAFLRSDCRSALSSRENLTRSGMSLVWVWVGEEDCVGLVFLSLRALCRHIVTLLRQLRDASRVRPAFTFCLAFYYMFFVAINFFFF